MIDDIMLRAHVFLKDTDGKFLIMLRNYQDRGSANRVIRLPGGKLELGETLEDGLFREVLEEIGVYAVQMKPIAKIQLTRNCAHLYPNDPACVEDRQLVFHFYEARFIGTPVIKEPEKFEDIRWVNVEELTEFQVKTGAVLGNGITEALMVLKES